MNKIYICRYKCLIFLLMQSNFIFCIIYRLLTNERSMVLSSKNVGTGEVKVNSFYFSYFNFLKSVLIAVRIRKMLTLHQKKLRKNISHFFSPFRDKCIPLNTLAHTVFECTHKILIINLEEKKIWKKCR